MAYEQHPSDEAHPGDGARPRDGRVTILLALAALFLSAFGVLRRAQGVTLAIERNLVGDWEVPDDVEVPLPPGYYLAYDPLLAAEQPALPLSLDAPEPEKPHTITSSGGKASP